MAGRRTGLFDGVLASDLDVLFSFVVGYRQLHLARATPETVYSSAVFSIAEQMCHTRYTIVAC